MNDEQGPQGIQGLQGLRGEPGPMGGVPPGSVVITPETMYRDSHERYGRIEAALANIRTDLHPLPAQVAEHDTYINLLRHAGLPERFTVIEADVQALKGRWMWALGAGSAAAFLAGILGSLVPSLFG